MAETYSYPGDTINSDYIAFRNSQTGPLTFEQLDANLAYIHNLTLAGGGFSSKVLYKSKQSGFESLGVMDVADGEFGVQVLRTDDSGDPTNLIIYFPLGDLWGDKSPFWDSVQYDVSGLQTFQTRTPEEPDYLDPDSPIINRLCPQGFSMVNSSISVSGGGNCISYTCCSDQNARNCFRVNTDLGALNVFRSPTPPSGPQTERLLRLSRIAGLSASQQTFTFKIDSLFVQSDLKDVDGNIILGGKAIVVVSAPPSGGGDQTNAFCRDIICHCEYVDANGNVVTSGDIQRRCCWWNNCQRLCKRACNAFNTPPDNQLESKTPTSQKSSCPSCQKNLQQSPQSTVQYDDTFNEAGVAYSISIVESAPTTYTENVSLSTNNSMLYRSEDVIIPQIDTTPSSGYSSTAFNWGRFNVALTKFANTSTSPGSMIYASFTASVSSTASWPKYSLTSRQFDYKSITTPHPSSGIAVTGRYYYQLAVDRTHPSGSFNSMLTNLDAGYRVNVNIQVPTASVVGTYSGPYSLSTLLHNYSTLTGSIVNIVVSSTYSLPTLRRNSIATLNGSATRIFTQGNKYALSFNEYNSQTTNTYSTVEDSFWQPLIQATNDKVLTISQVGVSNYWKFRIVGSSSKVKTKSRALAQGKNTFEYIFRDAYLMNYNSGPRPGVLPTSVPNTFPSNVQYTISYTDYVELSLANSGLQLIESSIIATASTYSYYLDGVLEERQIAVKRTVGPSVETSIVDSVSETNTLGSNQFKFTQHLLANQVTAFSMSQTIVAINPMDGGKKLGWFENLEREINRSPIKIITKTGEVITLPNGKPQRLKLDMNYCPPCPDGKTLDFYVSSLNYVGDNNVILGNDIIYQTNNMGDFIEVCEYLVTYDDSVVTASVQQDWEQYVITGPSGNPITLNTFGSTLPDNSYHVLEFDAPSSDKFFFRFQIGYLSSDLTDQFGTVQQVPTTVQIVITSPSIDYWGWAFFTTDQQGQVLDVGKVKLTCTPRGWTDTTLEDLNPQFEPSIIFDYNPGDTFYFDWDGTTARWIHNGVLIKSLNKNTDWDPNNPSNQPTPAVGSPVRYFCVNSGTVFEYVAYKDLDSRILKRLGCWFEPNAGGTE